MKNYLIAIVVLLLIFSCKQKEQTKVIPVNMSDTIPIAIGTEKEKAKESFLNEQHGDTIKMLIQDEKGNYSAIGTIDSIHPRIYVKFVNDAICSLKASVIPAKFEDSNIRFNQIIFPDKTADGPFGKDLEQELTQNGEYILIIGHSQMAENPYQGKFKVEIQLSN
ncbi:MAG: hypothetical protein ABIQ27_07015 [Flavobacterium sp.]|uniref:hypothetical protein n=1 Tax=Flavobacterium sp. TaxID=239 RepID=UPI0032665748